MEGSLKCWTVPLNLTTLCSTEKHVPATEEGMVGAVVELTLFKFTYLFLPESRSRSRSSNGYGSRVSSLYRQAL